MKHFIIDIMIVILIMCFVGLYFDEYEVSKVVFDRSIEQFENQIDQNEIYENTQIYNQNDNMISYICLSISEMCISMIQFITIFFSNFISMILSVVLY